ncbi:Kinase, CMGC MAPK [Reticulomyxa filosa]|uniref:Kinase, CMGC MAPK n=1 Tax=Reticulomyxa filosa TaxID=46433 RepID=X6NB65_RETFI|nr:Kinase, CMGC MAPK [Reticulomyxa filosa]|eukprot:ETO22999.1 Kinase, CMGC MAPK [Reticulomyxa filosa]
MNIFRRNKEGKTHDKEDKTHDKEKQKDSKSHRKVKNIFTPKPNNKEKDDDSSDDHGCEDEKKEEGAGNFKKINYFFYFQPLFFSLLRILFVLFMGGGKTSYGVVYEGKALVDIPEHGLKANDKVAIKKVRRVFVTVTDARRLLREIRILSALQDHSCIVSLLDILPPEEPSKFLTLLTYILLYVLNNYLNICNMFS